MITATGLELRAGSRILVSGADLRVQPGDRIGLVGRNGAGKTTTMNVLAGLTQPYSGKIENNGPFGYLPQDPRFADLTQTASNRVLSARGLDQLLADLAKTEVELAEVADDAQRDKLVRRYSRLEEQFSARGGYQAESEAARICSKLGLEDRILAQPLETLSGGQRRRVELARILFSDDGDGILLLDEPTNHLDADSINWLRGFLAGHKGGLVLITHDVELLDEVVNTVWFLDPTRSVIDQYNLGWKAYQRQRAEDAERRRRERANAEKKAEALTRQAAKLGAKATKAKAAKGMLRRAEAMIDNLEEDLLQEKVADVRLPQPAPCGKVPLTATGLSKSYGSLEIFTGVDLAIDRGSRVVILGLNGAGKTTLLRMLAGTLEPDTGAVEPGYGLRIGYFAQEHDTLDHTGTVLEQMQSAASDSGADLPDSELRKILGAFLFPGDDVHKPVHVLSGGEKTRLALASLVCSGANVLLLDEPTNNLDPASRQQVLDAVDGFTGAIVMVTHDPGAVEALRPERAILLPDGDEDLWSDDLMELVELA
ncbi:MULTISPECIES: ABC-F family ATP-binding cassette domain-containing protein [Glycomyces]|uniref:ATPase subunit of ABC transporter with duplicated ATPase domains n=3 Tax=Glycomyces artemisiae TaxID=1076443 RepID=A0A2T0UKN7_9ACTN|nr:ABC-F family ATP-binding cassette domain-containing protein [Glycomyces artemisiae]PRY58408.1 ATPase subunit of ABC transporter with duplicated ATPase domains [Glycomyces artemisiae]